MTLKRNNDIELLFFELVQVSIGNRNTLTHTPNSDEWRELYAIAEKQSLIGICFAAIEILHMNNQTPPMEVVVQWFGAAEVIRLRNDVVNTRCVELFSMLKASGFCGVVLKGQDYARYYNCEKVGNLSSLRQSGDIDMWILNDRDEIISWAENKPLEIGHIDIKHSDMHFFNDTKVEIHFQPSWMYCPITNRRLLAWFNCYSDSSLYTETDGFAAPPLEFSLVYAIVHIYRHFFSEGIGLRQVLDYYFLLQHSTSSQRHNAMVQLQSLNMSMAVKGIMYLLEKCFGLTHEYLLTDSDSKVGEFLLNEMLVGGNFGHADYRFEHLDISFRWQRGIISLKRNMRFLRFFPEEVLWSPLWKIWHYCWRKHKGYL